jgi:hypothetical protein
VPKIQLQNTTSQPYEFTEYHADVCARRGECKCAVRRVMGKGGKEVSQKLPRSFRIDAKGLSPELDREVLAVSHIKGLVDRGVLTLISIPDAPNAPAESAASAVMAKPVKGKTPIHEEK